MRRIGRIGILLLCLALLSAISFAQSSIITTVAGNGTAGSGGDGGPATSAQLNVSTGLTVDTAGNLYFVDREAKKVRRVTPEGVISTAVGSEYFSQGFPSDVTADAFGNVYITANDRIVKVTPAGAINFTNTGIFYTTAITADLAGNIYISDWPFFDVPVPIRKGSFGGAFRTVGSVPGEVVWSLAVDFAGNLYSAGDSGLWKLEPQGGLTKVQSCPCCAASDLAVDSAGNLFVADGDSRVCMVTPAGIVTTVAGNGTIGFSGDGGSATSAQLNHPTSVAVDKAGNVLVGDSGNLRIRKVTFTASSEIFFSQVAVGGGYHTTFALSNTGDSAISGNLALTDQQGQPIIAATTEMGQGSSFPISIAPAGTMFLTVNPPDPNDPVKSGWAKLTTAGGVLHGVATLQLLSGGALQTVAGVLPSQPVQYATISVDEDYSQGRVTAYALANPTSRNLVIKLALVDEEGKVVNDTLTFTLGPKQQISRYLYQDLALQQFKGSIVLRAQQGGSFAAAALVQHHKLMTVIPVIPGKAPRIPE